MALIIGNKTNNLTNPAGVTITYSHTHNAGANGYLFIQTAHSDIVPTITGITYNGVSMTNIDTRSDATYGIIRTWRLASPTTGANNVVITFDTQPFNPISSTCLSVTGAAGEGNIVFSGASAGPKTLNLITTRHSIIWVGCIAGNDVDESVSVNGSSRSIDWSQLINNYHFGAVSQTGLDTGNQSIEVDSGATLIAVAIEIKEYVDVVQFNIDSTQQIYFQNPSGQYYNINLDNSNQLYAQLSGTGAIIPMATNGEYLGFTITQSGHGFSALNAIYHNGSSFEKAQSDSAGTLGVWVVSSDVSSNMFEAVQSGKITVTSHGLDTGYYFVSESVPGELSPITPSGTWSNPILFVQDVNTVHVLPFRPSELAPEPTPSVLTVRTINSSQTILGTDDVILVQTTGSSVTTTLPNAIATEGKVFNIKKITSDSNSVIVSGVSAQTIDDSITQIIADQYNSMTIVSNGSNWFII